MQELQARAVTSKPASDHVTPNTVAINTGAPRKVGCHLPDGTPVDSCASNDPSCICDPNWVPPTPTAKPSPCGCAADDLECNIKCSAAPFDDAKAEASLAQIEGSLRDLCLGGAWDAPSGSGRAKITFGTSGLVSTVQIDPPYAGTVIGACIEKRFTMARVPSFAGSPVTVPKSFFATKTP